MHVELCIGWLESREGPFLGLRALMQAHILPRFPGTTVRYHSWKDEIASGLQRSYGTQTGQASGPRPLILLGHSYGASALVRAAGRLPGVTIDHLIMLDPVPRWLWGQFQWTSYRLPRNVKAATCLYNPWSLPKSSPIRGGIERFRNITVSPLHASIPGDADVQRQILEIIAQEHAAAAAREPYRPQAVRVPPVVRMGL